MIQYIKFYTNAVEYDRFNDLKHKIILLEMMFKNTEDNEKQLFEILLGISYKKIMKFRK